MTQVSAMTMISPAHPKEKKKGGGGRKKRPEHILKEQFKSASIVTIQAFIWMAQVDYCWDLVPTEIPSIAFPSPTQTLEDGIGFDS